MVNTAYKSDQSGMSTDGIYTKLGCKSPEAQPVVKIPNNKSWNKNMTLLNGLRTEYTPLKCFPSTRDHQMMEEICRSHFEGKLRGWGNTVEQFKGQRYQVKDLFGRNFKCKITNPCWRRMEQERPSSKVNFL
jgi:cell division protein FtsI (penicillin-binding protein 3)